MSAQSYPDSASLVAPRTLRPMMLPSLSISPISNLDVEDFPGQFARRGSEDSGSGDDSEAAREKQRLDTAARRASHNAVERQRRDRLNARILELASLLPNLAGVRRPSRIAITKSSIAYIHNSRKQRILASQQLRALHAESEALRAELNTWRQRAGVAGVPEPRRGEGFMMVLSGAELEIEPVDICEEEEYDSAMLGYNTRAGPYPHGYAYGGSPPSSSGSLSPYPAAYPSPPSSATTNYGPAYKYDAVAQEPRIACPAPATVHPFESQQYVLQTEEEWAAMYGSARAAQEQPHGTW
ncbi:Macrophage erythroblast attacher isoform 1 [Mycena kentingensis (nom. inval.)]|nr:Macrophage erythroblast attacher isoform 1 [Mycena kentingensis (nom. inval.)]